VISGSSRAIARGVLIACSAELADFAAGDRLTSSWPILALKAIYQVGAGFSRPVSVWNW
jgi:hypothetical protein